MVPVAAEVKVARGDPTAEELAALVTVLRLHSAAATPAVRTPRSRSVWSDPAARLRPPLPRHWR